MGTYRMIRDKIDDLVEIGFNVVSYTTRHDDDQRVEISLYSGDMNAEIKIVLRPKIGNTLSDIFDNMKLYQYI